MTSAGRQFRARMDAELARVGAILGQEAAWSPGEIELLDTVARDTDRRAALERAHAAYEDISAPRALKVAQEIRLIEAQTARLVRQLQKEIARLLAQKPVEEKPQPPMSAVSRKAQHAANTRWRRERLRENSIQEQYRQPGETG
jgi:hypothetical protein